MIVSGRSDHRPEDLRCAEQAVEPCLWQQMLGRPLLVQLQPLAWAVEEVMHYPTLLWVLDHYVMLAYRA